ncbi:MAG TPA: hydrolase [Armatimonadetes bacterium]|nr:hydrolase [Armatimonadota bacterium]
MLPGTGTPWLLLHGTGADEHDLVPVARELVPTAPIISPRGRVLENGMARWFERYPQGGFNLADYHQRAAELLAWIEEKQKEVPGPWVILGYSNGANIAPQLLRLRPDLFAGAVLWRAMVIDPQARAAQPLRQPVLLASGEFDPILPIESAVSLAESLETDGADVEFVRIPTGHGLTPQDLAATQNWIERHRFAH